MISVARQPTGRTACRLARQHQRRHVGPKARAAAAAIVDTRGAEGGRFLAAAGVSPAATSRALVSKARAPPRLAGGRAITASSMVPEPLVTMVPRVPGPFQPLMDKVHPIMIKERRPMRWLGVDALDTVTNAGALCGHFSFAILTLAYLETDVLKLRYLVACGSTLNVMFNLFRVVGPPVWIPIKWNAGFLALNTIMVLFLLKERQEAEELGKDPEQARIFREIFERVQLSPVHFLRLMDAAERRVMLKGNDLIQEGRPHEEVFLIVEGQAEVRSEGVAVSHLQSGGFVGSMAFNRFIKKTTANPHSDGDGHYIYKDGGMFRKAWQALLGQLRKQGSVVGEVTQSIVGDQKSKRQEKSALERSTTTVTATSDVVVYVWDQHALREFIKRRPMIGACLQKAISVDLVNKVVQSRDHKEHYRQLLAETLDGGRVTSTERKNLQRYREGHRISMAEHFERLKENNWTHKEFQAGFREGVAPKDLSENFLKYEALLRQELSKGELKPEAKSNLRKFRSQQGIDAQEHLIAVEKQGWTADEYEAGKGNNWGDRYDVGGTAVPDLIPYDSEEMADFVEEASIAEKERYRFLLLAALGGGVIQKAEKEKLELYREMHAIPDEEHNRLLFEQGWKPEEYAAGFHKDIASSHFQRYASLVKRELTKGKVS
ncbi:unnamed protein product, partial [Ectocarpus fasciculatus]